MQVALWIFSLPVHVPAGRTVHARSGTGRTCAARRATHVSLEEHREPELPCPVRRSGLSALLILCSRIGCPSSGSRDHGSQISTACSARTGHQTAPARPWRLAGGLRGELPPSSHLR